MLGWATGGLIFGMLGDRWGRAKTMALTILIYAFFTGFSAYATNYWEFVFYRFLTGAGVGGEFAAGAALLSEVLPNNVRAKTMGMLQALSAVGNVMGAAMFALIAPHFGWRNLYLVGAAPALLAVFVRFGMKEPDRWLATKAAAKHARERGEKVQMGGIIELLKDRRWGRNALAGMGIAIAGVICLWAIGFYLPELIRSRYPGLPKAAVEKVDRLVKATDLKEQSAIVAEFSSDADQTKDERFAFAALAKSVGAAEVSADGALSMALSEKSREDLRVMSHRDEMIGFGDILQQIGAFFGMYVFAYMATRWGRRPAFLISFLLAWASVLYVYTQFTTYRDIYYMWPLIGFCMLLPFGGYAIYFPELFPTRFRTTGTGLCYNVGRYVSAFGPTLLMGYLTTALDGRTGSMHPFRAAALMVSSFYIVGIIALIWAPETKGLALPGGREAGFFAH